MNDDEAGPTIYDVAELTEGGARYWLSMDGWMIDEAAHLLLGIDPTPEKLAQWGRTPVFELGAQINYENAHKARRRLLERSSDSGRFSFPAAPAVIIDWAMEKGLRLPALLVPSGAIVRDGRWRGGAQADAPPKPLQRLRAQEVAILAKLVELGIDPQAMPPAPPGKLSAAKQTARAQLGYSKDVMNKAWNRLRTDGRIKDATTLGQRP